MDRINGKEHHLVSAKDLAEARDNSHGLVRGGIFFIVIGTLLAVMIIMTGGSDGGWTAAGMIVIGFLFLEYGKNLTRLPAEVQVRIWRRREQDWRDNLPDYYKNPPGVG